MTKAASGRLCCTEGGILVPEPRKIQHPDYQDPAKAKKAENGLGLSRLRAGTATIKAAPALGKRHFHCLGPLDDLYQYFR